MKTMTWKLEILHSLTGLNLKGEVGLAFKHNEPLNVSMRDLRFEMNSLFRLANTTSIPSVLQSPPMTVKRFLAESAQILVISSTEKGAVLTSV